MLQRKIVCALGVLCFAGLEAGAQLAGYGYSKHVILNTSSSGANVTAAVANFPVPVQLNASNFDFTQAKPDGSDIRFSKSDLSPLPHEIELWDATAKVAAVWVKADIQGNSASQYIVMNWGNAGAVSTSDGKAVFPTTDHIGVWHLGEDGNTTAGGYKDATSNQAHGTGINYVAGTAVEARIGKGTLNSNANKTWILVDSTKKELFNPNPSWTLFMWTKIKSFPSSGSYHTMMSKGDGSWSMQRIGNQKNFEPCCWQGSYHMCAVGKLQGATETWYRFAASFTKGSGIKFYINAANDANAGDPSSMQQSVHPMGIGNQTQGGRSRWWDGIMDEVRVTQGARTVDWIKLDYESAKEGSTFVTFGPLSTSGTRPQRIPGWIGAPMDPQAKTMFDLQGRRLGPITAEAMFRVPGVTPAQ